MRMGSRMTPRLGAAPNMTRAMGTPDASVFFEPQKMSAMLQDFMKDVDAPWLKDAVDKQTANYAKIGGIPVLSRHFADGKAVNETTLKSIRTESIPAASFAVPAGYTRREMMPGR